MGQRRSPRDVTELELLAAAGWRGTETGQLGDWLLRAGGAGFSSRSHSALAVGDPGMPADRPGRSTQRWPPPVGTRPTARRWC